MRLRKEFVDQAVAILEVARKRTHAGVSMPAEVAIAQGDVGLARVGVLEAEGLYVNAMTELRQALGLSPGADLTLKGDIEEMTEGPPKPAGSSASAMGADAATSNPTFANLVAQARLNSQERLVLRATMGSRWALSGTVTQEGTGNTVVVGTLSLPIPFFDPAAFETSRLKSKEDAIFAQTERSLSELQMRMRVANHEVTHTREVREALQKDALPALKEALRLAKAQYVAGTQDITMVLLAKQRLLGAEEQVKRNAADILRADLQWSHLQGRLTQEAP
jgi:cobalt-zinc-cadmium efflux system outer membrane protein